MRLRTLAAATVATLAAVPAAAHAEVPEGTTFEDVYLTSGDGTKLHADVIRPKGATQKTPVILSIGPYFNHSGQTPVDVDPTATGPNTRFKDLYTEGKIFAKGYSLVQVDLPGFGASDGCNDFGGVREQAAVKAAVEWAAAQPWSTGKVGMWGKSYDGWTGVMGLATKPKGLAAAVIMSPIIDGYRTLWQNDVHLGAGWYGTPAIYQASDAQPISIFDSPEMLATSAGSTDPACYGVNITQQTLTSSKDTPFWAERDLVPRAKGSEVPVLWSHGYLDANTKPDNFMDVWSQLKGPKRAWFGQFTHVRPQDKDEDGKSVVGREGFIDEAMRWFDRYLKDDQTARVEDDPAVEVEDGGIQRYRAEAQWPPADQQVATLPLKGGQVVNRPGNNGDGRGAPYNTGGTGLGTWTFTPKLPYAVHLSGVPKLTANVSGIVGAQANVHALLYDVSPDGKATLVTRSAYGAKKAGPIGFELYPQDWTFKKGHRLGFLFGQSDDNWYVSATQGALTIEDAKLALPFLRFERTALLESVPTQDEKDAPEPFAVTVEDEQAWTPPAALTIPTSTTLPTTPTAERPAKTARFSAALRATRTRLIATGRAPARSKVLLRVLTKERVLRRATVTAGADGRYVARFTRPAAKGRYRVVATTKAAGTTVRTRSKVLSLRRR